MNRFLFLFALLFISNVAQAQFGGYLGRRFLVTGQFTTSPSAGTINGTGVKYNTGEPGFRLDNRYHLGIEYVVKPNFSIGFSVTKATSAFLDLADYSELGYSYEQLGGLRDNEALVRMRTNGVCLHLRKYLFPTRGNIGPLGLYVDWGIHYMSTRLSWHFFDTVEKIDPAKTTGVMLTAAVGSNYVIGDRVTAGFGFQFLGLPLYVSSEDLGPTHPFDTNNVGDQVSIGSQANLMMFYSNLIRANVSIGVLLF